MNNNLKSALWEACLYIAKKDHPNSNQDMMETIADSLYNYFINNIKENSRQMYEYHKTIKKANEHSEKMPEWKREYIKIYFEVNKPTECD